MTRKRVFQRCGSVTSGSWQSWEIVAAGLPKRLCCAAQRVGRVSFVHGSLATHRGVQ